MSDQEAEQTDFEAIKFTREFLVSDYDTKIQYLLKQFDRLWVRFNFFLTFESSLFVALGFLWGKSNRAFLPLVCILGIVTSAVWMLAAFEDRVLVKLYRGHVKQAFETIKGPLFSHSPYIPDNYCHVGEKKCVCTKSCDVKSLMSITSLPICVAGISQVLWTGIAIYLSLNDAMPLV